MIANLSRTASKWLDFYIEYVSNWWSHITFNQYMFLMGLSLFVGWLLLKSCVKSAT
ncbi:MAG: hypothetical protein ACYTGL_11335 [Planctomycetota bacterium]